MDSCLAVDPTGVACCSHGADCGAAGPVEMPDWDVSLVTSMSELFYNKGSFNADISRWDTSSVTNMYRMFHLPRVQPRYRCMGYLERHEHDEMFESARAFNQDIGTWDTSSVTTMYAMFYQAYAFNQHLSRWDVSSVTTMGYMFYDANAFNTMPVGWDTSKVTDSYNILFCRRMEGEVHGRQRQHPPRQRVDAHRRRVRRVLSARQRRRRQLHRHPRERHVLRPGVRRRVRAEGRDVVHRPGADRVAVCTLDVTTRAELKAAVDACVGDRFCEGTMPHWDVSRVTDMSFLFQGKSQIQRDIRPVGDWR